MNLRLYSDGGARGNPGPAAFAVLVCKEDGTILYEKAECIGTATNNEAEYRGLIAAILLAIEYRAEKAEFVMDSELVIKQMLGQYKVRSLRLKDLHADATALAAGIPHVSYHHVKRNDPMISRADRLLNKALDSC